MCVCVCLCLCIYILALLLAQKTDASGKRGLHELAHKLTKPSTRHTNELNVLYVAQVN